MAKIFYVEDHPANRKAFSSGPFVVNAYRMSVEGRRGRYERSGPIFFSAPVERPDRPPNGESYAYRLRIYPHPVAK